MTTEPGRYADSRAILIGVSVYEYADFPPILAARNSLLAMREVLADPALCGWPPSRITSILNPVSVSDLAIQVAGLAENTSGVLLVYYVGHGVLSNSGELCLTLASTSPNYAKHSGLLWETLADILRSSPARIRIAILDCCFAGQAIEALGGEDPGLADITHVKGAYTLTATARNRAAHVPPPDRQDTARTSFTGELYDLIRDGIPGKPSQLTLGDLYPVLRQRLHIKGLPLPNQRGTDTIQQFPFTSNAAVATVPRGSNRSPGTKSTAPTTRKKSADSLSDQVRMSSEGVGESLLRHHQSAATAPAQAPRPPVPHRLVMTIKTTQNWINCQIYDVTFSPDGRLLASADRKIVRLWDPATGHPVGQPLTGHTSEVWAVAFSPDGHLLASAGADATVRLWDPATGHPVGQPLIGHTGEVKAVAFSPDGHLLASAGWRWIVPLWEPATGQLVGQPLTGHTGWLRALAFSPDGHLLASAGNDKTVRLWDPATGHPVGQPLTGHTGWLRALAFSPDGHLLASAGNDKTVRLWGSEPWRES